MLQLLSFALFATVMMISIAAIVATVRAEMPYILRALGIVPQPLPPLHPAGERRVRVIRSPEFRPSPRCPMRAAA
ncbi:hypothetical protein [Rhizorhabdus dicambivorans]|uniref:hypothetical protein n=1 Tax=Rhizorhabdus dicambivorans TaxID=1850238 RepID=UPI000BBAFCAE|nr:hypothetical protein [Rhizorhabdus dicambivorans]ATE65287.1 hypothetical protein CMV14_13460 [Rhizorhabdus dicambivorans]